MLKPPPDFIFSQSSLQDYLDCPQRFFLRYIRRMPWPCSAVDGDFDVEERTALGQTFHRLAQQKIAGIPDKKIQSMVENQPFELQRWWQFFTEWLQSFVENEPGGKRLPEFALTAGLGKARLYVKYDLLVVRSEESAVIYDWKTLHRRPPSDILRKHVQSRLYPYVLARAGESLNNGKPFLPENIQMVYWFTADPYDPQRFEYNREQYQADEAFLSQIIQEILGQSSPDDFPLTLDEHKCTFCLYRTYCDRRAIPELQADSDDESDTPAEPLTEDWEQIGEIEY